MQITVTNFDEWRSAARHVLASGLAPADVVFRDTPASKDLFDSSDPGTAPGYEDFAGPRSGAVYRVPGEFMKLARNVACHRDRDRYNRLYRTLWRVTHGEPHLLQVSTDDDVYRLESMERAVLRDSHKMKAFVRFRRVVSELGEQFIAWHRPDHQVVRITAPFFARRFPSMRWTIMTPDESVSWDLERLHYGAGVPSSQAPQSDELEDLWKTYYSSIFNPARIKLATMTREMPRRHWATLPETAIIPDLLADAPRRVDEMIARQSGFATSAADFLPDGAASLDSLRLAARRCQGCDLHRAATQTVFGEGSGTSRLMLVGEQPGDQEDLAGRPFVGPAGRVLDEALAEAGIEREQVYLTNAVKHFKYEPRGKRRIHSKPDARQIAACKPWLEAEVSLIQPAVLVCLGGTAAHQLVRRDLRITKERGRFLRTEWCDWTMITYHPSAILRCAVPETRQAMLSAFASDLAKAAGKLSELRA